MPVPWVFRVDGFLGLSFLKQFTFRLDYQRELLFLAPAGSRSLAGAEPSLPVLLSGQLTTLVEVDGTPAHLVVDTGGGQGLILRSWFVEEQKLRERYPKRLSVVTGGDLLGLMHGEITRLRSLKLGDHTLTNVFAEFETKPSPRHDDVAGYVGGAVLRRFNLTFDLAGRRMWIEPNAHFTVESPPLAVVRSGLVCLPEGTNWIMQDVVPASPAVEAGVRRGDRLLEIDGVSVQSLNLDDIKRPLKANPGTRVRLRLQTHGAAPREVVLTLRDLL
jgi:hypothetical protein